MKVGKIGRVPWEFKANVLTFGGGVLEDNFDRLEQMFNYEELQKIKKVVFTSDIYCGKSLSYMFNNFTRLKEIIGLNKLDTSNVTDMAGMFQDCESLTNLDLSNFNTSNVTDMSEMFYNCKSLENLDLRSFNTRKVTNMDSMFEDCWNLTHLHTINFNISNVKSMSHMFYGCEKLMLQMIEETELSKKCVSRLVAWSDVLKRKESE